MPYRRKRNVDEEKCEQIHKFVVVVILVCVCLCECCKTMALVEWHLRKETSKSGCAVIEFSWYLLWHVTHLFGEENCNLDVHSGISRTILSLHSVIRLLVSLQNCLYFPSVFLFGFCLVATAYFVFAWHIFIIRSLFNTFYSTFAHTFTLSILSYTQRVERRKKRGHSSRRLNNCAIRKRNCRMCSGNLIHVFPFNGHSLFIVVVVLHCVFVSFQILYHSKNERKISVWSS